MNILILNWKDIKNPEVGGAEIILYEFSKRWIRQGHTITWFCRSFQNAPPEETIAGIHIIRKGNKLSTYFCAYSYYKSLTSKPDIVLDVLNTIFWQTPLYIERKKHVAYVNQLAKEVFWYELPPIVSHIAYLLEKLQFKTYINSSFLCYADSTKDDLVHEGIPRNNIHKFKVGLDHTRYRPGKKASYPLFLCVSRLVRMKRTDAVIEAMSIVQRTHPNARLAIVGYGYQRQMLGKLRDRLGLQNTVSFIDEDILFFKNMAGDKKVELMQKAWGLVFPSVKEGWGMTVTECAACGTPAIVSNVAGLRDSVQHNRTGLVLSKDPTPTELADAIISIIENNALRKKLSKNAISFAQSFSWDQAAHDVLGIVEQHIHA